MYDVVIIGAGAAGLVCACTLKKNNPNIKFLVLEKNDKVGKKLALTGNGRCNLGNSNRSVNNYHSSGNLDRFKEILESGMYLDYLKEFGVYIKEENNLLYPNSNQALGVVKAFERYIEGSIKYNYDVKTIDKDDYFIINNDIKCKYLVIATGGMSYQKTGSTGDGYKLLGKYHNVIDTKPVLVPLLSDYKYLKDISGVRFDCKVKYNDKEEVGQVQFTDYGLSGICIFNLSRYIEKGIITLDLIYNLIDNDLINFLNKFKYYKIEDALSNVINNKLAQVISKELNILGKKVCDVDLNVVINKLHNFKFDIIGRKDYDSAQITGGGLNINEFNTDLSSKNCENLYAVGEVLDIDGRCGGYNLTWAFTSAILAANSITKKF